MIMCNVYMPCDTDNNMINLEEFDATLSAISVMLSNEDASYIIIGGDFNTDFGRSRSLHTTSLKMFIENESLKSDVQHSLCQKEFTFESKINGSRSRLDHFLLSENLFEDIKECLVLHDAENMSDHSALSLTVAMHFNYAEAGETSQRDKLKWSEASLDNLNNYRNVLDTLLGNVPVPSSAVSCDDSSCLAHSSDIDKYHDAILEACRQAAEVTIPKTKILSDQRGRSQPIAGWNEHVAEHKRTCLVLAQYLEAK